MWSIPRMEEEEMTRKGKEGRILFQWVNHKACGNAREVPRCQSSVGKKVQTYCGYCSKMFQVYVDPKKVKP